MNLIARSCTLAVVGVSAFVAVVDGAPVAAASALACSEVVFDQNHVLDLERIDPVITSLASELDGDVRVRVEGTLDGGLDRRIEQLIEQCPGWQDTNTDEIDDDMVVIMFSPVERENSIFYGADLGPVLEDRWDAATEAMIPGLRQEDYTEAVLAGLRGLSDDSVGSTSSGSSSGDGTDGVPGEVVFWLVVIGIFVVLSIVAKQQGWSSGAGGSWDGDDDSGSSGWLGSSSRRRRSSFSFGSFGSRSRSSGGGSRRSGGGSRRAGGGTKKW